MYMHHVLSSYTTNEDKCQVACFPVHIIWISVKRFAFSVVCGQWFAVSSCNLLLSYVTNEYNCLFVLPLCLIWISVKRFSLSVVCGQLRAHAIQFLFIYFGWLAFMESIKCSTVLLRKIIKESSFSNV